jgi:hypothetical protein
MLKPETVLIQAYLYMSKHRIKSSLDCPFKFGSGGSVKALPCALLGMRHGPNTASAKTTPPPLASGKRLLCPLS